MIDLHGTEFNVFAAWEPPKLFTNYMVGGVQPDLPGAGPRHPEPPWPPGWRRPAALREIRPGQRGDRDQGQRPQPQHRGGIYPHVDLVDLRQYPAR